MIPVGVKITHQVMRDARSITQQKNINSRLCITRFTPRYRIRRNRIERIFFLFKPMINFNDTHSRFSLKRKKSFYSVRSNSVPRCETGIIIVHSLKTQQYFSRKIQRAIGLLGMILPYNLQKLF